MQLLERIVMMKKREELWSQQVIRRQLPCMNSCVNVSAVITRLLMA